MWKIFLQFAIDYTMHEPQAAISILPEFSYVTKECISKATGITFIFKIVSSKILVLFFALDLNMPSKF